MAAIAVDDIRVLFALVDTQNLTPERNGRFCGCSCARKRVQDGFTMPTKELD